MIEKSCNLLEQPVDFPRKQGGETSSASSDEHLAIPSNTTINQGFN